MFTVLFLVFPALSRSDIGDDFMVISNVNSWITCTGTGSSGSLISPKEGSLKCTNVKDSKRAKALGCSGKAPNKIKWHSYGPYLGASSLFYY